jgi:hypothetical protein
MTNPYRACLAELLSKIDYTWGDIPADVRDLMDRARALLAQPVAEGPKPVVDYSRVTEIATEAQIRSAAQYLVKKRNCDGDLIPAIEYAIARWGAKEQLRADRRPEPPSLKKQALESLQFVDEKLDLPLHNHCNAIHTIRRAIEQLPD